MQSLDYVYAMGAETGGGTRGCVSNSDLVGGRGVGEGRDWVGAGQSLKWVKPGCVGERGARVQHTNIQSGLDQSTKCDGANTGLQAGR